MPCEMLSNIKWSLWENVLGELVMQIWHPADPGDRKPSSDSLNMTSYVPHAFADTALDQLQGFSFREQSLIGLGSQPVNDSTW